jgi:hypothetical protein
MRALAAAGQADAALSQYDFCQRVLDWLRWRWLKASWARLMFLEDIPAHHALLAAYKL